MCKKKYLAALLIMAVAISSVFAAENGKAKAEVPTPIATITVFPVAPKNRGWVNDDPRHSVAAPIGVQYRGDSGALNLEIDTVDRFAPNIGFCMEFMEEEIGVPYPSGRFEIGAAFYPLYPHGWKDHGFKLMTDISLGMKVVIHNRPRSLDGRLDLYLGAGFEFSLFNPRSDQNEVKGAFGHEMGKLGNFDQGAGLNAILGIGFDVAKNDHGKWTLFLEGELRQLLPLHIYVEAETGLKYTF